jgi:serine/threonine protein kinase
MGSVYRARDTILNRDVALKILPDAFAGDADRLARFTREAQVLASLNHPTIAHIHGLEESGGIRALVMELVEGDDLSQRVARGAIPVDEALSIAKQIADALEAAHQQGIIHRDLKPANIKLRPDGAVKVLDFGLAKAPEFTENQATFSPDARWIAYATDETGQPNVSVQPFLRAGGKYRISPSGGRNPHWRADGKELFYLDASGAMTAVPIDATDTFTAGLPKTLFATGVISANQIYIVTKDGQRFLVNARPQNATTATPLTVIVDWASTLQK